MQSVEAISERILYWLSLDTQVRALAERLLQRFAVTVGDLPASAAHHHAEPGGLYRHSLEVALKALEEFEGNMMMARRPDGSVDSFRSSRERPRWQYATFIAALCHDVGKLFELEVRGKRETWCPLASLTRIPCSRHLGWNGNCQFGTLKNQKEKHLPLLTEGRGASLGYRGHRMSKPSDLVQGTLDMLLLKILALEPMNGFAVSQRLKQVSGDILQVSDGSLYPALHKLEQEGWITAEWKTSDYGRRAKYYSLTRLGRRQLEKEADNWGRLSSAISRVIKLKEA